MMLSKSTILKHYKRKDVQDAIITHAHNKEIGVRYDEAFGKRPDALFYAKEVLELALQNVTSFHASEELWDNPLTLNSNLSKKELEELRIGWDLVLDIDCLDWEFSKLTTHLFIKALKDNQVKNISCKFSGNKGFHIGVPFQAFPSEVSNKKIKDSFPELPRKISEYLLDYISRKYIRIEDELIYFDNTFYYSIGQLKEKFGNKEFIKKKCTDCKKKILPAKTEISEFICPQCERRIQIELDYLKCEKCFVLMEKIDNTPNLCTCGSNSCTTNFDPSSIVEIDTLLISSRHLYRMPYSLHEKSGLVSLPLELEKVLEFTKDQAHPDNVIVPSIIFMDRTVSGESARQLLMQALDFKVKLEEDREPVRKERQADELVIESPITEEFFPPCMKMMLKGLEDGKKRAVFCLMNFLGKIGWNKQQIEEYLMIWNKEKNREPLREVYIKSQLAHFEPGQRLPPNCDNEAYYQGIGVVCQPNEHCHKFKNPVNYTLTRWKRHLWDKQEEEEKGQRQKKRKKKGEDKIPAAEFPMTEEQR